MVGMTRRTLLASALSLAAQRSYAQKPEGLAAIQMLLKRPEPVTWVFTGDSITHGAAHTFGWRSYSEHFAERLRWEMRRVRDFVINTGISGDRLHRMNADIERRVLRFKPDVVSAMFGMNDCLAGADGHSVFRSALAELKSRTDSIGAALVLHTPNFIHYPADIPRKDLVSYAVIVREFAAEHKVLLVDHYAYWEKTRQKPYSLLVLLADAAIHPNQYGHILLAHETFRTLGMFDSNSATCRLFVP